MDCSYELVIQIPFAMIRLTMFRTTMEQIHLPPTLPCLKTSATLPHPPLAMVNMILLFFLDILSNSRVLPERLCFESLLDPSIYKIHDQYSDISTDL